MRFGIFLTLALLPCSAFAESKVAVSIKPLHSLVAAVMEGEEPPVLLVEGSASAHTYQLKPSQMKALLHADIVFYTGGQMENFLSKPLSRLPENTERVALASAPGVHLLPVRSDTAFGGHLSVHQDNDEGATDMHIWLNPANALAMVDAITSHLAAHYPDNAARYHTNANRLKQQIAAMDANLRIRLQPLAVKHFILFHDATHYFEEAYGLKASGALMLHPEIGAGLKHADELHAYIANKNVACVFREPAFDDRLVQTITRDTGVRITLLDPEGVTLMPGPALYFQLMDGMAKSFQECLG